MFNRQLVQDKMMATSTFTTLASGGIPRESLSWVVKTLMSSDRLVFDRPQHSGGQDTRGQFETTNDKISPAR